MAAMADSKISQLEGTQALGDGDLITVVQGGQNKKITRSDFLASMGATGSIVQAGDPSGVAVLDKQGAVNAIRTIEAGAGIFADVSSANGITLKHRFQTGNSAGVQVLANAGTQPLIRSLRGLGGVQVTGGGDLIQISYNEAPIATNTIIVNSLADFPEPVAEVIPLGDDTVYLVSNNVDVGANRFQMGANTSIRGNSLFATSLTTSATGYMFTGTDGEAFEIADISVSCAAAELIDAAYTAPSGVSVILSRVSVDAGLGVGRFGNLKTVLINECVFVASQSAINFSGAIDIFSFGTCSLEISDGTAFSLGSAVFGLFIADRAIIASINAAVKVIDGLPDSGNIAATGHGTLNNLTISGAITQSTTVKPSDVRWSFYSNYGLENSQNAASLIMQGNATVTPLAANTPTKIAGTTFTSPTLSRFTATTDGRMTYIGKDAITASISAVLSTAKQGSGVDPYTFYVAKNGAAIASTAVGISADTTANLPVPIIASVPLVTGDYLELFVEAVGHTDGMLVSRVTFGARG